MAIEVGTRLGVYEVIAQIGAGGMGEVYRAHDTTLDRDVAIKVLPDAFATDPERLARFEREAKVLASLNHPNIAAIYGLEKAKAGEPPALILELVEGPTLAEMLAPSPGLRPSSPPQGERSEGKPLPLEEALPIARQIAEALEAAHEQGIIHRDLKPANVKVKDDGTVKVLDFGLAKALGPDLSDTEAANSPTMTMTAAATKMGVIMGTAAYMSPEQAKGRQVDKRADIWAFGVVLFEMLTGRQAFGGTDISETLAAVLRQEMDWAELPSETPHAIRRLLRRCLERDHRRRLPEIGHGPPGDRRSRRGAGGFCRSGRSVESRAHPLAASGQYCRHRSGRPLPLAALPSGPSDHPSRRSSSECRFRSGSTRSSPTRVGTPSPFPPMARRSSIPPTSASRSGPWTNWRPRRLWARPRALVAAFPVPETPSSRPMASGSATTWVRS